MLEESRKKINICGRQYRLRLALGCLLQVLQQLSGINAVVFYSSYIFQAVTSNSQNTIIILTIMLSVLMVITSFLAGAFTKCFGRKTILWFGTLICLLSLALLFVLCIPVVQNSNVTVTSGCVVFFVYFYILGFGCSLGPIVWLYNAEILPS